MGKLRSVQLLRGLAACCVVLLHAYYSTHAAKEGPALLGAAGVDLFFVISGFIMATIAKKPSFLFDRLWRIFPLWLIAVSAWLAWYGTDSWQSVASSLTLWPVYSSIVPPALPVGWTLSFELLFYCAVALSLRIGARVPLAAFSLCFVGGILTDWPILQFLGSPMILEFLFGILVAGLPKDERLSFPLLIAAAIVLLGSPAAVLYDNGVAFETTEALLRVLHWGVPAGFIVYAALAAEKRFTGRASDVPVLLGNASYSIYLFHLIGMRALHLPWPIELVAAIGSGVAVWWLVERFILTLKPSRSADRRGVEHAPAPTSIKLPLYAIRAMRRISRVGD